MGRAGRKMMDITGQKYGKLTAVRYVRHSGKYPQWEFRCECGGTRVASHAHVRAAANQARLGKRYTKSLLHCGCDNRKRKWPPGFTASDSVTWRNHWKNLCARWRDSQLLFMQECLAHRNGRFLERPDRSKPLSPDNFRWSDQARRPRGSVTYDTRMEEAVYLLTKNGWEEAQARDRIAKCSRQRVYQIIWSLSGLCRQCRQPATRGSLCEQCAIKHRESKKRRSTERSVGA